MQVGCLVSDCALHSNQILVWFTKCPHRVHEGGRSGELPSVLSRNIYSKVCHSHVLLMQLLHLFPGRIWPEEDKGEVELLLMLISHICGENLHSSTNLLSSRDPPSPARVLAYCGLSSHPISGCDHDCFKRQELQVQHKAPSSICDESFLCRRCEAQGLVQAQ